MKLLIIYPHWMPSNLVGAQRARLISNYTLDFGWSTHILSVNPIHYESTSVELSKLVNPEVEVSFVPLDKRSRYMKGIGDLALLAYSNLKEKAIEIIKKEKIDFVWYPIPSYYNALLARPIYRATGVKYGIDYIDPWVDGFPGQEKVFSKAWIANKLANILEPYSVKKASLVSGVAYHYYQPVLERNFKSKREANKYNVVDVAMQYGFDSNDYHIDIDDFDLPWDEKCKAVVYAGAFLPKSHLFLNLLFGEIRKLREINRFDETIKLYFIGTGPYLEKSILKYAKDHEIDDIVYEQRERISYLRVLKLLKAAFGVLVLGSTEMHYTASKVFQSLLSGTPVFTIFHEESEAAKILTEVNGDTFLTRYNESLQPEALSNLIGTKLDAFVNQKLDWSPELLKLEPYSSKESARLLIEAIEKIFIQPK